MEGEKVNRFPNEPDLGRVGGKTGKKGRELLKELAAEHGTGAFDSVGSAVHEAGGELALGAVFPYKNADLHAYQYA